MDELFEEELEKGLRGALALTATPSVETLRFAVGLARLLPHPTRPSLIARLVSGGQPLAAARGGEAQQRLYETDRHLITLWDEADVNVELCEDEILVELHNRFGRE